MLISNADIGQNDRQALKLGATELAWNFCPYQTGIIDPLAQILLPQASHEQPHTHKSGIGAKLPKLRIPPDTRRPPGGKPHGESIWEHIRDDDATWGQHPDDAKHSSKTNWLGEVVEDEEDEEAG